MLRRNTHVRLHALDYTEPEILLCCIKQDCNNGLNLGGGYEKVVEKKQKF
jgi:hypothetical protein